MSRPFRCWACGGVTVRLSDSRLLTKFKCIVCLTYWWMFLGLVPLWRRETR